MATINMDAPTKEKLKKPRGLYPAFTSSSLTTRFGGDAIKVNIPLISAAYDMGNRRRDVRAPVFWEMRRMIGIKIATTAVELMTLPSAAALTIIKIKS